MEAVPSLAAVAVPVLMERQQQNALRSCSSLVVKVVGVVAGVAGATLGAFVVVAVVGVGCGATLIISKSSSGSFGMFLSLSDAPLVQVYLP